jgi:uncharacterized protein GlcG (DUF336 family)
MNSKIRSMSVGAVIVLFSVAALAAGSGLPGDRGRPRDGIPAANPPQMPADSMPNRPKAARAPAIDLALKAALAIGEACKQYPLGVTVVNSEGVPILIYVPNGSEAWHGYSALRKAYTAITFKAPTSQLVSKAQQDPDFAAKIKADPNLMAFSGGVLLKVKDDVVGAIAVSGAEPGSHDEECGLIGVEKIKNELK